MRHLADEKQTENNNNKFLPKNENNEPSLLFRVVSHSVCHVAYYG